MAARHSPSPKVVETLLAEYAEAAGKPDKAGNLPLHLAFLRPLFKPGASSYLDSCKQLHSNSKVNIADTLSSIRTRRLSVMHLMATRTALAQTVALLIEAHPEGLDARDGEGRTPAQVGKNAGAAEDVLALVRRAEFMAGATQSLLG